MNLNILLESEVKDTTLHLFENSYWFLGGLLLYFIIILFKVHIDWYLRAMIFRGEVSNEKPFSGYFLNFFKAAFGSTQLYRNAFRYLFKYKTYDSIVANEAGTEEMNKQVEFALKILTGLTTFLNPYIIISFLWMFLKVWIDSRFMYDTLSITLGAIQTNLNFIDKLPFIHLLTEHKSLTFFVYGLLCFFIPFIYENRTLKSTIKRRMNYAIVSLSIISHLSFFGAMGYAGLPYESQKLKDLEAKIVNIHSDIYTRAATAIMDHDLAAALDKQDADFAKAIPTKSETDNILEHVNIDNSVKYKYSDTLNLLWEIERNYHTLVFVDKWEPIKDPYINHVPLPGPSSPSSTDAKPNTRDIPTTKDYSDVAHKPADGVREYIKTESAAGVNTKQNEYIKNPEEWNIEKGNTILENINHTLTEKPTGSSRARKLISRVTDNLFDYLADVGGDGIFKFEGAEGQQFLKEFLSLIFTEKYKNRVVEGIGNLIDQAQKGNNITINEPPVTLKPASDAEIESLQKEIQKVVADKISDAKQKNIALLKKRHEEVVAEAERIRLEKLETARIEREVKMSGPKLEILKYADKWEGFRRKFLRDIASNRFDGTFSDHQIREFQSVLSDWDSYCHDNIADWIRNGVTDLEPKFLRYMENNPKAAAAMGFIIQQEDLKGAVNYFTYIAPESGVTGKPYNMLRYYLKDNGFNVPIGKIYTDETNHSVGIFCPH